ncbi:hypothetical protein [Stenotrophomonas sp. SMYL8]|uniref:protein kinase domain-containing protein n=1 Tax=Stenotrophomonas sp. SMYL8 TaxID=3076041 RepID=UPI002E789023|nr:hypothetical protein [Stenotrophomonas sp. SMYL8]
MTIVATPADDLEGQVLDSGWIVGPKIGKKKGGTGSNFGVCYSVTRGEELAFMKAVDFRTALAHSDPLRAMLALSTELTWEKEALEFCAENGLSKIVRLISHEYFSSPGITDPGMRVSCLVMEVGAGDLRGELSVNAQRPFSWVLSVMRDVCLAVDQLHRKGVCHLDVKPSNVIAMDSSDCESVPVKLGDLGRVVRKGVTGPFDSANWPGDRGYQPPEKWYGFRCANWNDEREAGDAFLVGSLFVFLITQIPMPTMIYNELPDPYKPELYRGSFNEELINVLRLAQVRVLTAHVIPSIPSTFRDELERMLLELTHPDPRVRGNNKARKAGTIGIDRYHQRWHQMARRMKYDESRVAV